MIMLIPLRCSVQAVLRTRPETQNRPFLLPRIPARIYFDLDMSQEWNIFVLVLGKFSLVWYSW